MRTGTEQVNATRVPFVLLAFPQASPKGMAVLFCIFLHASHVIDVRGDCGGWGGANNVLFIAC